MLAELTLAKRSWFVTLTYSPIALAGVLSSARSASEKDVERAAYGEVQKWLKRTRQRLPRGARLRYVAIFERGDKHGRAHYHLLVHEVGNRPVLKRHLQQTWPSISNASLVRSAGVAAYLLKYLTKSVESRVRASAGYGGGLVERKVRFAKPPGYDAQNSTSSLEGVVLDHRSVLSYFVGGLPRGCEHSHVSTALAGALVSDAKLYAGYSRSSTEGVSGEHEPASVASFDVASFVASFRTVAFGGAQPRYGPRGGGGRGGGDGGWRSPRGCTVATAPPCAASAHGTDGSL